jgi:fructose-1,6-bisphosphatase-3
MAARAPSPYLAALADRYPTARAALAEIGQLEAQLALPAPPVHVVSDVHGEAVKFRHVVNNASGSLRPRLERLFAGTVDDDALTTFTNLLYYPHETWARLDAVDGSDEARRARLATFLAQAATVLRELCKGYPLRHVLRLLPESLGDLVLELVFARDLDRPEGHALRLAAPFVAEHRELELVRLLARAVRNLSVGELVVAGDLGDRGPRMDRVIDQIMVQPRATITWGNHDASWMGACLGQPALIANVVRISLRYRRVAQLEEGYGIPLEPLEDLARRLYATDPCERFAVKGEGQREPQLMARMQKAIAILQFKLEAELLARHPEWGLGGRALVRHLDLAAGTVTIDGASHPLADRRLPTIDATEPARLHPAEQACIDALRAAFLASAPLWRHMTFVARHGAMWLRRDPALVFHGCVPCDDDGRFLELTVDGAPRAGRALFDAIERVVARAFQRQRAEDVDLFWYLWCGPRSPCFGKDRIATFESHFVADAATHHEHKNAYFRLIADRAFCARVLAEFGADPARGLIVNGHVPVRPDRGETPVKASGQAVTIDGAFAAAYGDRGYSLVLQPDRVYLAQHHHFGSVDDAVVLGADIVPTLSDVVVHPRPLTVGDTEAGEALRAEIAVLRELVTAYQESSLEERE